MFLSDDVLIWGNSVSGSYSVKEAYHWLTNSHYSDLGSTDSQAWFWGLKIPENIKHFLWLSLHGSLPTNHFRTLRHTCNDASRHICGSSQETFLHTPRECPAAIRIWETLSFAQNRDFHVQDCTTWLKQNMQDSRGTLFMVTCWIIWRARNSEIFNDSKWELWHSMNQISSLIEIIQRTLVTSVKVHVSKEVKWSPPENIYKINVDGSSIGNPGKSGFGGLIRNMLGEWLCGYSGFCGVTSCLNAELLAIFYGLSLAWSRGLTSVICEPDSQMALQLISKGVDFSIISCN